MIIQHLELTNFRNYASATISLTNGVTAIVGNNGQGKTNLTEALSFLATLKSFRGVPNEAMIRTGSNSAIIRATVVHDDGREVLIEAELARVGRNKVQVNRQKLARTKDLLGVMRTTVFSPEDLDLVKDSPGVRRQFLDDALVAITPTIDALLTEFERVLKQRNALLKQSNGRLTADIATTLDVWDEKFATLGTELGEHRARLVATISPEVSRAYEELAEKETPIAMIYEPEWRRNGLASELASNRNDDIRRGSSTVGPHRDDVNLLINEGDVRNVVLSRAFRLLQEEDYNTAVPRFLEMFGDEALGFVVGKTYTNTDGLQASREFGDWVIANPDLVNNAPEVYAYFAGDVGNTFDFYTFSKQVRTDDRARWTDPMARLENSEAVAGRAFYLEAVRNSGVDDNPFREEFLREYRNFLEQSLPGFLNEPMYTNIQDIQIRRLQDALELDATIGNPAADGMRMYFEYRDDAIRVAQARRPESGRQEVDNEKALSGNSNSDLRSLLRIVGFKISQDNPAFAKVWSEVLFTEVDI